ncbi:MAG: bifunctional hydroxymethylpyrimidine kinase/phosphomethylpyrimidine kinase [Acidobacteria bacterium]|nr:bifunctional hydroxymethylpyrimidine kinase/phosphomethylpyrimidine kinase [Acidobacteriota bacterium]
MTPVALTVAGSDPSGGAGIQADLKTFHHFRVYGEAAITLITVQNTQNVSKVELLDAVLVREQIEAVMADIPPAAMKTGALGSAQIIESVAGCIGSTPLVVDPVMISKHGAPLIAAEAAVALRKLLFPKALLVTPNLHEAAALTGLPVTTEEEMIAAARKLLEEGPLAVLVKGGHLSGKASDVLVTKDFVQWFTAERTDTPHTHGTGCTYSAAITALLAKGLSLPQAVEKAKLFITKAIATNPGLGAGHGPVNHFA